MFVLLSQCSKNCLKRKMQSTRTPEEAKAWLERHGVTASEWARSHGFAPAVVFALLSGRTRGRHGAAHRAAVALGLKAPPPANEEAPDTELGDMPRRGAHRGH